MTSSTLPKDRLLRFLPEKSPTPGLSRLDVAKSSSGPHISRDRILQGGDQYRRFAVPAGWLLCPGAAVGICADGKVRHIRPWDAPQRFVGFVHDMAEGDKVLVWTRGATQVLIDDLAPGTPKGARVYADGPNSFSLLPGPDRCEVGQFVYAQPDRPGHGTVAFKAYDDNDPVNLDLFVVRQ